MPDEEECIIFKGEEQFYTKEGAGKLCHPLFANYKAYQPKTKSKPKLGNPERA